MADISPGQVVLLRNGEQATVRFVGPTDFAEGEWIGVELDNPNGKSDGSVKGKRYFYCKPKHAIFVRSTAITVTSSQLEQEPRRLAKGNVVAADRGRTDNGTATGSMEKRLGRTHESNVGRDGTGAPSPSPAPRQRAALRPPTKLQTKQLSTGASARLPVSGVSRPLTLASKPRPSAGVRAAVANPGSYSSDMRTSRSTLTGPANKATKLGGSRAPSLAIGLSRRLPLQATSVKGSPISTESDTNTQLEESFDGDSQRTERETAEDENLTLKVAMSVQAPIRKEEIRLQQPLPPLERQAHNSNTARNDELQAIIKVMEKRRAEDHQKLKEVEQLRSELDRSKIVTQKLQDKYRALAEEANGLRAQLQNAAASSEEAERLQAEHDSLMEMATLDRDMAMEIADALKDECRTLRIKVEELQLELDVLQEENEDLGTEDKSSHDWIQMEKTNERLREALIRLRDITQQQETDLKDYIKELKQDLEDYAIMKSQYESTIAKLHVAETNCDDLKQQLETALGAEEMIEELTDKNMRYQEQVNELRAIIEDLEALKDVSDELEYNHAEVEKQLLEEIDYKEGISNEQCRKISQQNEIIEDLEYTMTRFRELVTTLQGDLEDMRASQQISEAESNDLTARSRAIMDLNTRLQASVVKAQTKAIDVELSRMDAEEAVQHLSILKLYLPEYFEGEKNSILTLLCFKRIRFKASLMSNAIRERISEQSSIPGAQEEFFVGHEVLEKLFWIVSLCDRFMNYINSCSAESFASIQVALFELEPVERKLSFWIEGLKKNDIHIKGCALELQRSIALLSHLGETILPISPETLADELCMRSLVSQSYLEHTTSSISKLMHLIQTKITSPAEDGEDESEEKSLLLSRMDSFVSQSRGLKVTMGKIYRSVDELRSRSLTLSLSAADQFNGAEEATKELSELSRQLGENIQALVTEEGRTEPFTLEEVLRNMSQTSIMFTSSSRPGMENDDAISLLAKMLQSIVAHLDGLDLVSSDLSITTEFEKRPHPWVTRAKELKSNKTISPDADEEIRRLKNEIHEVSTAIGVKDKTIEEQAIRVELIESRMRDATKKASMAKELEAKIAEIQSEKSELTRAMDSQRKELQDMETERDEYKSRLERLKRASGAAVTATSGDTAAGGATLTVARENEALRTELESLQAAVRFLREENRRNSIFDPYSVQRSAQLYSWLDIPLTQTTIDPAREKARQSASESRDAFAHLLKLTQGSSIPDLRHTTSQGSNDRTAWRPLKTRFRYQILQQREIFEHWAEWRDDIARLERQRNKVSAAKRERPLREQLQKYVYRPPMYGKLASGLGDEAMGHTWQALGVHEGNREYGQKMETNGIEAIAFGSD